MTETELRAMVREVLREALQRPGAELARGAAAERNAAPAPEPGPPVAERAESPMDRRPRVKPGVARVEQVRIASDADLAAFVARLAGLMADPAKAAAIRSGRLGFTLATGATAPAPTPVATSPTTLSGTVTERTVVALPKGAAVRLAPGAVVTPLARDRARAMGIRIERRR